MPGRTLRDRVTVRGGGPSIEDRLGELLGRDVVVVIGLGPAARANRKPILHVLTPKGRAAAFVKVGDNAATRALIADEPPRSNSSRTVRCRASTSRASCTTASGTG
ncbi:hypothetical protein BJF79_42200 [Actinomadura sp. CNU-125]|uniref:hypothetical protein n=1 Tax=Actinomadura sp. CNU-125 TaxID=1904961 RepID=UPI0009657AF7|nr:hypothetical protein [Actinomadura sp. CNU-125]OLT27980.1 hypothetical protein BJF79_42200 [Actinomadura sp. CNU-125]